MYIVIFPTSIDPWYLRVAGSIITVTGSLERATRFETEIDAKIALQKGKFKRDSKKRAHIVEE